MLRAQLNETVSFDEGSIIRETFEHAWDKTEKDLTPDRYKPTAPSLHYWKAVFLRNFVLSAVATISARRGTDIDDWSPRFTPEDLSELNALWKGPTDGAAAENEFELRDPVDRYADPKYSAQAQVEAVLIEIIDAFALKHGSLAASRLQSNVALSGRNFLVDWHRKDTPYEGGPRADWLMDAINERINLVEAIYHAYAMVAISLRSKFNEKTQEYNEASRILGVGKPQPEPLLLIAGASAILDMGGTEDPHLKQHIFDTAKDELARSPLSRYSEIKIESKSRHQWWIKHRNKTP